jgi:hypothetical protein
MRRALAALFLLPLLSCAAAVADAGSGDVITIENSGSTNMEGYRIVVAPDGRAQAGNQNGKLLSPDLFAKLKYDVAMAMPLHDVKTRTPCVKPVSFGSTTMISLGDEHSGDLSCFAGPKGEALFDDAEAVAKFLDVGAVMR